MPSTLSSDAKILYILLENRANLSERNREAWTNKYGDTFVYFPQKEAMARLNCGHDKVTKVFRELQKFNLIKRIPQGLGKSHMIVVNRVFQFAKTAHTAKRKIDDPASDIPAANNIEEKNPEISNIESNLLQERQILEQKVKENINYDILSSELDANFAESVVMLIVDTLSTQSNTITIGGERKNASDVAKRLLSLNDLHIRHIYHTLINSPTVIRNPKAYMLKLLYESIWATAF